MIFRRNDEGSMPLAMLVVIIGVGMSMLMMTTVVRGANDTNQAINRTAALLASRSGLSSGLASLRAAGSTGNLGAISALPCSTGAAQVTGTLSTKDGSYATTIWYLKTDPTGQTDDWVKANGVTCPATLLQTPRWAYVISVGTSTNARYQRTLIGTYQFKLRAMGNMPGGQIRVYRTATATQDYCLTASYPASLGSPLVMSVCQTKADGTAIDSQKFGYMTDLTVRLMTADTTLYPNGLCAQAGTVEAVGQQLKLQDCGLTTQIPQQWAFDSASNLRGTSDGRTSNVYCWNISSTQSVVLNNTTGSLNNDATRRCGLTLTNYQNWNVTADAGSGAAGPDSGQLVNFKQFGKCLDFNYSGVYNWAFPCKQQFNVETRDYSQVWNEVWTLPDYGTKGLVYVTRPDLVTKNCMKAPAAGTTKVTMTTCPASAAVATPDFLWWARGDKASVYDEKYRIEGTGTWAGQCLAPLPAVGNPVQADWVGLTACTGDYMQKWNAVPPVSTSGLASVIEK